MTKAEKHMGVVKPKHRPSPEKPTPLILPTSKQKGRFGYTTTYHYGRRASSYTSWFATEIQRDQSLETRKKKNYGRQFPVDLVKVER